MLKMFFKNLADFFWFYLFGTRIPVFLLYIWIFCWNIFDISIFDKIIVSKKKIIMTFSKRLSRQFYSNPFQDILAMMIRLHMIPYRTVSDVVNNLKDERKLKRMAWIFVFLWFTVCRFLLSSVFYENRLSFYLIAIFHYEVNGRAANFAFAVVVASPISMCKCLERSTTVFFPF